MNVAVVDDHDVVRLGLRTLLDAQDDITVVGEAGTVADAVDLCARIKPELVLMDIRLPDGSGVDACRTIRAHDATVQVVMLTSYADPDLVVHAIEAGAAGYVLKQLDTDELLRAVRGVRDGGSVLDPAVTKHILQRVRASERERHAGAFKDLTAREIEILARVAEGLTNPEIADRLVLSEKTVRNHVSSILGKLGLGNRIEAATFAVRHDIDRVARGD
jgi:DNA-binding NarL/FixJ family response regulator